LIPTGLCSWFYQASMVRRDGSHLIPDACHLILNFRLGQRCLVYIRVFWLGNNSVYIRIHTVLADPKDASVQVCAHHDACQLILNFRLGQRCCKRADVCAPRCMPFDSEFQAWAAVLQACRCVCTTMHAIWFWTLGLGSGDASSFCAPAQHSTIACKTSIQLFQRPDRCTLVWAIGQHSVAKRPLLFGGGGGEQKHSFGWSINSIHFQACWVIRYGTNTVCKTRTVLVVIRLTTVIVTPSVTVNTVKYGSLYGTVPSWHCQCKNGLEWPLHPNTSHFCSLVCSSHVLTSHNASLNDPEAGLLLHQLGGRAQQWLAWKLKIGCSTWFLVEICVLFINTWCKKES
jgi:hypothetical protein